jgi:hypothetical protein
MFPTTKNALAWPKGVTVQVADPLEPLSELTTQETPGRPVPGNPATQVMFLDGVVKPAQVVGRAVRSEIAAGLRKSAPAARKNRAETARDTRGF